MFLHPMAWLRSERQVIHLDRTVPWGAQRAETDRLPGLGATRQWDVLEEFPHVQWTTWADVEGHLSCVPEHPPANQQTVGTLRASSGTGSASPKS